MAYLIGQITLLLVMAFICGIVIGWLLRNWRKKAEMAKLEKTWRINLSSKEQDFATTRRELEAKNKNLIALRKELDEQKQFAASLKKESNGQKRHKNTRAKGAETAQKQRDNLQVIDGIGPYLEKRLNDLGIFTYSQIANLDEKNINKLSGQIGAFPDRIKRDKWVDKAKALLTFGG